MHGEHYQSETGTVRRKNEDGTSSNLGLAASARLWPTPTVCGNYNRKGASATSGGGLATVAHGVAARVDRLKALGNGQVPQCAANAWRLLTGQ